MTIAAMTECVCPPTPVFCAKCGGLMEPSKSLGEPFTRVLYRMEAENQNWILQLDSEGRLNSTLTTFRVIDKQYRTSVPIGALVSEAIKEIGSDISEMKNEVVRDIVDHFSQLQTQNESEATELRDIIREVVTQQTQDVMSQVRLLQEQGRSVDDIHGLLKEAVGSMQTIATAFRVPAVRGDEGELFSIRSLQEAFFGVPGIRIEPIGGSDATDAVVRFYQNEVEVGRTLVEVKSRKTWNNSFLEQVHSDMQRYNVAMSIIVADRLPRNSKGKGFAVDSQTGLVVIITQDLLTPTVTMFHEIQTMMFSMQEKALDLEHIASNKDLIHYVNDNMNCLEDCKQIVDTIKDSEEKIEGLVARIASRLRGNNRKIAEILGKLRGPSEAS